MAIDPESLATSLSRLATLGEPGTGVVEALRHVTEACVDLFCVTGSGIMLMMSRTSRTTSPHPTGPAACSK